LRSEIKDSKKKSEKNSYHQTFLNFLENNHPNAITNSHLNSVSFTTSIISSFKKLRLKKVYFDFETINLATRIVDNTLPFEQIVNQVSIIIDDGDGVTAKTKCENILFDPQAINEKSFKQIVDKILPSKNLNECGQYHYIVYNKSFEKSRLKAIDEYLSQNSIDRSYHNKINIICDNLFDLADFFNIYNVKDGYLYVKQLHGYYSIKRILPIVEKFAPKIFSLTGCKNYKKDLKINNGSDASETASLRFLNRISNAE
jgi:hypothetical protein